MFSRVQWVQTDLSCQPLPGTVDMDEMARALHERGIAATGAVVLNQVAETTRNCISRYTLTASWADMARLRDEYGWSFISQSFSYPNMTTLTVDQQRHESCDTLPVLASHGHVRAWGLFAYPNNRWNDTVQSSVVAGCFAYGRKYDTGVNPRSSLKTPWWQKTLSINGGKCEDAAAPCASANAPTAWGGYADPESLLPAVAVQGETWGVLQAYRFVTGSRTAATGPQWDCTGGDWRRHWTSATELYCWDDFLSVVDRALPEAHFVDPATVAETWGRVPGIDGPPETAVTAPVPNQQLPLGAVNFAGSATDDHGVAAVRIAVQNTATKQWWHSDGTWGAYAPYEANLDLTGAASTGWTSTWQPPGAGNYNVQATAVDGAGQADATPSWINFAVVGPADARPDSVVTAPIRNQQFSRGQVPMAGTATDDRGVVAVRIAVQNTVTKQWWHSDGTWGAYRQYEAGFDSPGATSTGWTFTWPAATIGQFALQVIAVDTAGQVDTSPPWVNFRVV